MPAPGTIPIEVGNGVIIRAQVEGVSRERDVRAGSTLLQPQSFKPVVDAIEGIATSVSAAFERVRPDEATVEFGLELTAESGGLAALLVKGGGKAALTITLKWEAPDPRPAVVQGA